MIQEGRQLLLVDICGRLPYGICANLPNHHLVSHKYYIYECNVKNGWTTGILNCAGREECYSAEIEDVQPYLRPMSSMTEDEKKDLLVTIVGNKGSKYFRVLQDGSIDNTDATIQDLNKFNMHWVNFDKDTVTLYLDWLNKHHFDYRGLIPKGLAISTEEFNPYKD